jgi:hypothetical protein
MSGVLNWVIEQFASLVEAVLGILPDSPIQKYLVDNQDIAEILGYINWFVPIETMMTILVFFLTATAIWYAVRWALRFAQYVE